MTTRHASRMEGSKASLCGESVGRVTNPKERVNCPDCRVILNHTRSQYPEHVSHTDWRLTKEQMREAARAMVADMYGDP